MTPAAATPRVSAVIPTWNRPRRVLEAVASVLAQTVPALEVLVVDDGSVDGTAAALAGLRTPGVRVISAPHRGVSAARNVGIERARGEWVAFLDSDDTWLPGKLERQLGALAAAPEPYRLVHCDEVWIRNGRRVNPRRIHQKRGGWIYEHCLPRCAISPSSTLVRRDLLADVGLFDESLMACEDYDLWLRICAREPVLYLDEQLVVRTGGHADQLSATPALDRYRIQALAKMLRTDILDGRRRKLTLETLQDKIRVYRAGTLKRGRFDETAALDALARELGIDPTGEAPPKASS
ncbi:MAG: glycosyltransferase [Acidobacteriota bacterium]